MTSPAILRYTAFTATPEGGNPAGVVLDASSARATPRCSSSLRTSGTPRRRSYHARRRRLRLPLLQPSGRGAVLRARDHRHRGRPGRPRRRRPAEFQTRRASSRSRPSGGGAVTATLTSVPPHVQAAPPSPCRRVLACAAAGHATSSTPASAARRLRRRRHLPRGRRRGAPGRPRLRLRRAQGGSCASTSWTTVHLVHREDATPFHARHPFPVGGVVEDPATGAAAAAFGAYLREPS